MTHTLLCFSLFTLLIYLLRCRTLEKLLSYEREQADKCFASWRHTTHELATMTVKATKLIGEKAQAESKIRVLEAELRRKHRRVRP